MSAGAPRRLAETKPVGDRLIGLGCLLAIVLAVAIGIAATIAIGKIRSSPTERWRTPSARQAKPTITSKGWPGSGSPGRRAFQPRLQRLDLASNNSISKVFPICALTLAPSQVPAEAAGCRTRRSSRMTDLIGLRNRLSVTLNWLWIHTRDQRSGRLITQGRQNTNGFPTE
jgi:hypothetical protein